MLKLLESSNCAELVEGAYRAFFMNARPGFSVLDLCSSWVSHFPAVRHCKPNQAVYSTHALSQVAL
eukprot:3699193-Amphidinium_carterae.1